MGDRVDERHEHLGAEVRAQGPPQLPGHLPDVPPGGPGQQAGDPGPDAVPVAEVEEQRHEEHQQRGAEVDHPPQDVESLPDHRARIPVEGLEGLLRGCAQPAVADVEGQGHRRVRQEGVQVAEGLLHAVGQRRQLRDEPGHDEPQSQPDHAEQSQQEQQRDHRARHALALEPGSRRRQHRGGEHRHDQWSRQDAHLAYEEEEQHEDADDPQSRPCPPSGPQQHRIVSSGRSGCAHGRSMPSMTRLTRVRRRG